MRCDWNKIWLLDIVANAAVLKKSRVVVAIDREHLVWKALIAAIDTSLSVKLCTRLASVRPSVAGGPPVSAAIGP
jgi:hypothetical protein